MNSPTSKNSLSLPLVLVAVALLGGAMFVWGRSTVNVPNNAATAPAVEAETPAESGGEAQESEAKSTIVFSPSALQSAGIKVAPVVLSPQIAGLPFNGEIEATPDKVARVASVVSGRVARLLVSVGQQVRQGQTLALIESRDVGEAQSAYEQAVAHLANARASYDVTVKQARAGVFSRAPLESAERARIEAQSELREQQTAVQRARLALDTVTRLARAGSFARPALEAARGQYATTLENLNAARAAQDNAGAAIQAAQTELTRRRQFAQNGGYSAQPVEGARRALVTAQAAVATANSEITTAGASLKRNTALVKEGLVATKDVEGAQTALDSANARLQSAQADETAAQKELDRQQKLAASNAVGNAEVGESEARLAQARADEKARRAGVAKAESLLGLARTALDREGRVFEANIANRREFSEARAGLANAQTALAKAQQTLRLSDIALQREQNIYRQNLNTQAQVQSARATLVSAQSDFKAAQTALSLLKSAPGKGAMVPLRAPLAGQVQTRDLVEGEAVEADKNLITLVNLSTVHVDMNLPERDIARVQVGAPVQIRVDAFPNQSFAGRVELIHSELDAKTRTLEAHAEISNPGNLRIGMFACGTIGSGTQTLAVMVPADAVQNLDGKTVVFVAGKKSGEFAIREVEVGPTAGARTLVKNGLKAGERIVVAGAFMVKAQGMKGELGEEE